MERRNFLLALIAVPAVPLVPDLTGEQVTQTATVTPQTINDLHTRARTLKSMDLARGGGATPTVALTEGMAALGLLDADCPPELVKPLELAVGHMALNVGFGLHDEHDDVSAARWLDIALLHAETAGNASMQARVQGVRARRLIALGQPIEAAALLGATLASLGDRLMPLELASLHSLRARAYAHVVGSEYSAREAIDNANAYWVDHATSNADETAAALDTRPWVTYSQGHHYGDIGAAWRELAARGVDCASAALGAYDTSLTAHGGSTGTRRSQALVLCSAGRLEATEGEPERAAVYAAEALDVGAEVTSARLTTHYRQLFHALSGYTHINSVDMVVRRLRAVTA